MGYGIRDTGYWDTGYGIMGYRIRGIKGYRRDNGILGELYPLSGAHSVRQWLPISVTHLL